MSESGSDTRPSDSYNLGRRSPIGLVEPGQTLSGRYQVTRELGRGGFGAVYLAEDRQLLSKRVVVKVLLEASETSWSRKKFRSELEALARIDHPSVVTLLDSGETPEGLPYLVMQYVEGQPLRSIITPHGIELFRAANIIRQIGQGLSAAHHKGVYHRDLKPENIMLQQTGDLLETVKIIDFGIATVRDSQLVSNRELTAVAGTGDYIAPEQLLGKPSSKSDIYAFGVIAYELVTGRVPYYAKTYAELFALQQRAAPVKPKDLRHEIPEPAQRLICRALSFNPEQRPDEAALFGDELAGALEAPDTSLLATRPVPLETEIASKLVRSAGLGKRRRRFALAGLAVLLAVVIAVAYWQWFRLPSIESLAVMPFVNTNASADLEYLTQGFTDNVINTLGRLPHLQVQGRMAIPQFRKSQPDARTVGRMLNVATVLAGTVAENNGILTINTELIDAHDGHHLWGQRYERRRSDISAIQADVCQEVARTLRLKLTPEDKRALRKRFTTSPEAEQLYLQGRFFWNRRTADGIKTAISYFNRAIEADPNYALPYAGLADALITQSGSVPPRQVMPQAELAALQAINKDDELAQAHAALASIKLHYDWDWLEAEKEYKRAIELDPSLASAHSWYAVYLWVMERFDDALAEAKRAQTLEPTSLPIRLGVARSFTMARRYDEALTQYHETLKMFPAAAGVHVEIGMVYERQRKYDWALTEYSKLWKGSDLPDDSGPITTMGHLYAKLGRRADALKALDRLKAMSQARYVSPCEIATVQAGLGDKQAAVDSLNRCYDDRSWEIIFLKLDPSFSDLYTQPGFQSIVRKLKL